MSNRTQDSDSEGSEHGNVSDTASTSHSSYDNSRIIQQDRDFGDGDTQSLPNLTANGTTRGEDDIEALNAASPLDEDHPYSASWPEVSSNGRAQSSSSESLHDQLVRAEGADPFDDEPTGPEPVEVNWEHRRFLLDDVAKIPPAIAFIESLASVEVDKLAEDDRNCYICGEQYCTGEMPEVPLMLPCQHVFGKQCLESWFFGTPSLDDASQHNNCPMCRRQYIFETREPLDTLIGLSQLLRDADYVLNSERISRLAPEERIKWEGIKQYVTARFDAAYKDYRRTREETFVRLLREKIFESSFCATEATTREMLQDRMEKDVENLERLARIGATAWYLSEMDEEEPSDSDLKFKLSQMSLASRSVPEPLAELMLEVYQYFFSAV